MNELSKLGRHSSHYLLGRIGLLALGFVSFPLFTRLFSVAEYGEMNLVLKIVLCFVVFSKLGIQNSVVRFYEESVQKGDSSSAQRYYSTLLFGAVGVSVFASFFFIAAVWLLPATLVPRNVRGALSICALLILIRGQWSILSGFLQAEGRTRTYNVLDVSIKAGSIIFICMLLFAWQRSVLAFFLGTIVVEAVITLGVIAKLLRRNVLHWNAFDWGFFQPVLAFGFPLVAYEIASVILDSGDRFLIQNYLGAEQLGYYSAAYNLSAYAQISLMVPINLALIPIYMSLWVNKGKLETQAFLRRSLDLFLLIAVGMCCIVTLVSHDLIVFLASKKFEDSYKLLPILIVGLFIYSTHIFLTAGLLIHKKTFLMARQVIYAMCLNIGLNILLLPRIGLAGAAWATLVSYVFLIALMASASFPLLPVGIDYKASGRYFIAACVTYLSVKYVHVISPFWGLLSKTVLGIALYLALLWLIDPRVRSVFLTKFNRLVSRSVIDCRSQVPDS